MGTHFQEKSSRGTGNKWDARAENTCGVARMQEVIRTKTSFSVAVTSSGDFLIGFLIMFFPHKGISGLGLVNSP